MSGPRRMGATTSVCLLLSLGAGAAHAAKGLPSPEASKPGLDCGSAVKRPGSITVLVVSGEEGEPLAGAVVTVVDPEQGSLIGSGTTGADGSVTILGTGDKRVFVTGGLVGFHASGSEARMGLRCESRVQIRLDMDRIDCSMTVTAPQP